MANIGLNSEILDGKLSPKITLPEDVVLVIDRAYSGPSNRLYPVTDSESAKLIFGSNSPLIHSMRHAFAGGAKNVALYRIGGGGAQINNLFGQYTALYTTDESVGAGSTLKVYAGPRQTDSTRSCVIVYKGSKIVYSNIPGKQIDLGVVRVEGFDPTNFPYQVGTLSDPVPFADILTNLKEKVSETFVATASQSTFSFTTPVSSVSLVSVTSGTITTVLTPTDYSIDVGNTTLTLNTNAAAGDVIEVVSLNTVSPADKLANELTYQTGKDSMNVPLNALYELYDTAFLELETVDAFGCIIADLFESKNIAAGDDDSTDRLTYLNKIENDFGFEYEWSENKAIYKHRTAPTIETTTDVDEAALDDTGLPIVVKQYHEVDFAHRLAMWCWGQSSAAAYVNGNIGPKGPVANYTVAINRWIGKPPSRDIYGNIVENGSGLLGNRFMAGTTARQAGFYATDTGYPDGNPLTDSSGVIIDIGKYLSIPVCPIYVSSEAFTGNSILTRSSSAAYAGLVTTITTGDSTTNSVLPNVTTPFKIKPGKINALSDLGYVVLEEKTKGLTVYSGDVATQSKSDYDYISTAIAVTYVLKVLKDVVDPYIGKGINQVLMAALYNAIDVSLKSAISFGYINGYGFNLITSNANTLALSLTLTPKDELRSINLVLSLAENNLFSI